MTRSVLHFNETTDFDLYLHYDMFNTTTTEVLIPVYLHISCEESMVNPLLHSTGAFKATLVWTDPPGASSSAFQLVNDLDLRCIRMGGE